MSLFLSSLSTVALPVLSLFSPFIFCRHPSYPLARSFHLFPSLYPAPLVSLPLSLSRPTVRGSPQLPAAALDNLVREPLRPAGTDGSYQVSGGAGCGLGPSVSCHRLLDRTLQQGTGFSTPVSSVVGVPCPLRMKKEKASCLRLLSVLQLNVN